ncbi:hypothetical protein B0E37_02199 [Streptomyces sp. MH192]|uniref:hypothetical protein n=1 Tax=Streptomyces sp. MH192 TaxID=1945514 RepID=UPI001F35F222|nr:MULTISPECIES: hypothetical protein [unclassified Streptomyces]MCF0087139.1 hypothetical protein [Streptomyces sp. MH192]MCF0099023.1 hypothetical protein [Streptomyces sp. MH191]
MTTAPSTSAAGGVATPPARPVRFDDPAQDAAYCARVRRIVDAFHGARQREAA